MILIELGFFATPLQVSWMPRTLRPRRLQCYYILRIASTSLGLVWIS
jgi:hypothetical protein